jgi:hypothetical protein
MGFTVEKSKTTPSIKIEKGNIIIKGRSIPEDSFQFYDPVINACDEYASDPPKQTNIIIHLDYVNSGSKKYLTNILTIFENSYLKGFNYKITWRYDSDDEAMFDLGVDLKGIIKIPIEIMAID